MPLRSAAVLITTALLVATGCGTNNISQVTEASGDGGVLIADASATTDSPSAPIATATDAEQAYERYEAEDRLPVADANGDIVGYMNFTEYYAGTQDPIFIEVRSYDDDTLIGYRLRFIGYVPIDELAGEGSIAARVDALYGDQQVQAQAYLKEMNDKINALTPDELRAALKAGTATP